MTAAEAAPTTERVTATDVRASDVRWAVMGNRQGRLAAAAVATTTRRTTTTARFIAVVVVARRTAAITAATTTIRNGRARALNDVARNRAGDEQQVGPILSIFHY